MTRQPPTPAERGARRRLDVRRDRDRRVLAAGLAVSLVLHLVVIAFVSDWLEHPRPASVTTPAVTVPPQGIRAVEIATPAEEAVPAPERPTPAEDERERAPRPAPAPRVATGETADSLPADALTAADRLAVEVVDPRLWRPMILIPREPTLEDVEARVSAALELLSDSALAEADAAMRARDWTVEDGSGGRWGISPGKLHLGKLTLPLPIWFPEDPEAARAMREWYEFDQQIERTRILDSFQDRVRAIRERRERERSEGQNAENGG